MTNASATFNPDWVSPPGNTIADLLEERGWKQGDLAMRLGYTQKHVSLLINGRVPITADAAQRLARVLGSTPNFWLTLEANYRSEQLRIASANVLASWASWVGSFPPKGLQQLGIADAQRVSARSTPKVAEQLLRYFGVASPTEWKHHYVRLIRGGHNIGRGVRSDEALALWIRFGEQHAETQRAPKYNHVRFQRVLESLRGLTHMPPNVCIPQIKELLLHAGVIFLAAPRIHGTSVVGMARLLSSNRPLIQIAVTGMTNDVFWKTLFHEAAHILLHLRKDAATHPIYFDTALDAVTTDRREKQADAWARNMLIPIRYDDVFNTLKTRRQIQLFAKSIDIHPGVVVGRLQDDGLLKKSAMNDLKVKVE